MPTSRRSTVWPQMHSLTFAGAAFFYSWAIVSLWIGPSWALSGPRYLIVGVIPAFLGVVCTVFALALHMEIQESDSTNRDDFWS
ncbi:MAG: hypothetical protein BRD53_03485 [Bacteroidetes bacterium SW_7_64_58]|nr:MAG: hypothetical protein BRD53_03485 [Bacteroidetes bacterium SW_7_64_58]